MPANDAPNEEIAPRRLIVLAWQDGFSLELDYEGSFDTWEVLAALKEAARIVRNDEEREESE